MSSTFSKIHSIINTNHSKATNHFTSVRELRASYRQFKRKYCQFLSPLTTLFAFLILSRTKNKLTS